METDKSKVPSFDEMLKPTVQALAALGGQAGIKELDQKVIELMGLDTSIQKIPHTQKGSDRRSEVSYRLAWARTYLKKYGVIENPSRSVWRLSEDFDGNTEALSAKNIVKTVRQKDWETFKVLEAELPQMETAQAFEAFVLSVLSEYPMEPPPTLPLGNDTFIRFDAFLSQGFHLNDRPTFVEIKTSFKTVHFHTRAHYFSMVKLLAPTERFLLILGEILSTEEKSALIADFQRSASCEVCVWDYEDLMDHSTREPEHIDYLEQPQIALAKSAIRYQLTETERKQNNAERIKILAQEYQKENLTLFLGAGVSQDSGLPSWEMLVQSLLMNVIRDELRHEIPGDLDIEVLGRLIGENAMQNPLTQVRYISSLFSSKGEYERVREILYGGKIKLDTPLLRSICTLSRAERRHIGVKGIVSYNFDDLLERALRQSRINHVSIFREKDVPSSTMLNVYHVHGYLPHRGPIDPDMSLIFSEEDYHKVYRDAFSWSNLTQLNAFRESTCLFIGCSLTDPNVRRLLDIYKQACEKPRHFAFMRRQAPMESQTWKEAGAALQKQYRQTDDSIRDDYFRSIGVNVIWVDRFDEIPPILESLHRT